MILEIKDIGLAAYMQMHNCRLIEYTGDGFEIATEDARTAEAWAVGYSNSCCCQHDQALLNLRNLVRQSRGK